MTTKPMKRFLTVKQLRQRWGGVSQMFIERKIWGDPAFPKFIRLGQGGTNKGRIRLFDEAEIEAYERLSVRGGNAA